MLRRAKPPRHILEQPPTTLSDKKKLLTSLASSSNMLCLALLLHGLSAADSFWMGSSSLVSQPFSLSPLLARKGAISRKKGLGTQDDPAISNEEISSKGIYSLPALYDLAFAYRNFEQEVDFLLSVHEKYAGYAATSVLELAAGPARHSLQALTIESSPVTHATALDSSPEMVKYGMELAHNELPDEHVLSKFHYLEGDMRNFSTQETFDTAWILLGSLQHMTTNKDVISCFQNIHKRLRTGGTLVVELPHPRETFSMVECTRNGWEVPLEDENGDIYGELEIVWGDEDDTFDEISQVRQFTVSMNLKKSRQTHSGIGTQSIKQVVPMRQFTAQEIDALATCSSFGVVAMFGALDGEVSITDEDEAFRLVCVLRKIGSS